MLFKKRKNIKKRNSELKKLESLLLVKEIELQEYENSIKIQLNELKKTIEVAQEYLTLCGYTEEDIERIRIRNKFKVINCENIVTE